jgi:hypothetical protein
MTFFAFSWFPPVKWSGPKLRWGRDEAKQGKGSVEPRPSQSPFDPDLDVPHRRPSQLSSESIESQLWLIVNPFLAVLGWVIVLAILRLALQIHSLKLFLTGLSLSMVPLFLFQYHCLDCGATGWVQNAWRHCCPAVTARAQSGIVRRAPRLSVKKQTIAWIYLLIVAIAVWGIFFASQR